MPKIPRICIGKNATLKPMKASQNLYAETLLKTIGSANGGATALAGRLAAESALQSWGVAAERVDTAAGFEAALKKSLARSDGPSLIEVMVKS